MDGWSDHNDRPVAEREEALPRHRAARPAAGRARCETAPADPLPAGPARPVLPPRLSGPPGPIGFFDAGPLGDLPPDLAAAPFRSAFDRAETVRVGYLCDIPNDAHGVVDWRLDVDATIQRLGGPAPQPLAPFGFTVSARAPRVRFHGFVEVVPPDRWEAARYRIDLYLNGEHAVSGVFDMLEPPRAPARRARTVAGVPVPPDLL